MVKLNTTNPRLNMRLTPNQRMALFLEEQGESEVSSFSSFIAALWENQNEEQNGDQPKNPIKLLSGVEREYLIEKIISKSKETDNLLKVSSLAKMVASAYELSKEWGLSELMSGPEGISSPSQDFFLTEEQSLFSEWATEYDSLCRNHQWIDRADLLPQLMGRKKSENLTLPGEIDCVGFLEWTPLQRKFIQHLSEKELKIKESSLLSGEMGSVALVETYDPEEECRMAARFVKERFKKMPTGRFGVVVPDLSERRREVVRIFKQELNGEMDFDVAAPLPLSDYPMIKAALSLLSLIYAGSSRGGSELALDDISTIFRSPFFGGGIQEMSTFAALDVYFRERAENVMTIDRFLSIVDSLGTGKMSGSMSGSDPVKELAKRFRSVILVESRKNKSGHWKAEWSRILNIFQWPGDRMLNSEEYQLKLQWDVLLNDYLNMDSILSEHSFGEALKVLKLLAKQKLFLPESNKSKIQVLGLLEAIGTPFEGLWVTGLHREAWPNPSKPNPLLPVALQKSLDMPRSSAARELRVAKELTAELCKGAKEIIFSWPSFVKEEATKPSRLLKGFSVKTIKELGLDQKIYSVASQMSSGEVSDEITTRIGSQKTSDEIAPGIGAVEILDDIAPKIEPGETSHGGTAVLKSQAACPFRAFAEFRLRAKPFPKLRLGLHEADRGEILHQILFEFWQGMSTQAELIAFSEEDLTSRLEKTVNLIFDQWQEKLPRTLTPRYRKLEQNRMFRLCERFIQLEKKREPFQVVEKEMVSQVKVSNLLLQIRLDRVDRDEHGRDILIDYKTGKISLSSWFGDRLLDPQLPLYGITRKDRPAAIAFASLRPECVQYVGLSEEEAILPGLKTPEKVRRWGAEENFEKQCEVWQESIENLAKEFTEGVASVSPLKGETTCRECELHLLCRVRNSP